MQVRSFLRFGYFTVLLGTIAITALTAVVPLRAQDDDSSRPRGRKYKAPPTTSKIEVTVLKGFNKKPIDGAHVIFHPEKDGKDDGYLELKTHQDGKAVIDVIPVGSSVRIQVLADGFATYAEDFVIAEPARAITVEMQRPQKQISTYVDNEGKPSDRAPGVQEPIRPKTVKPSAAAAPAANADSATPAR